MYRSRVSHWSNSKLAKTIRELFAAPKKPTSETLEGWGEWRRYSKTQNGFVHWFTEEFLDLLQDIVYYPSDIMHTIRYYFKNRFVDRLHLLNTRLPPGQYYELDTRILHGLFESLVDFVEVEKAHMELFCHEDKRKQFLMYRFPILRWKSLRSRELGMAYLKWEVTLDNPEHEDMACPSQAQTAREIIDLYTWWKDVRPARPDPYDVSGWSEYCKTHDVFSSAVRSDDGREQQEKLRALEERYDQEDETNLLRLIKIRKSLWT